MLNPQLLRASMGWLDWTRRDLAKNAGVGESTLRDFLNGRHQLRLANEEAIIAALRSHGVSITTDEAGAPIGIRGIMNSQAPNFKVDS